MRNVFWGIILIIFGVLFLLDNMDVIDFGDAIKMYWPLLLVLWGISILVKKKDSELSAVFGDTVEKVTSELFHESSVFGDLRLEVASENFKGGSISTVFGDCHVDLTKATIAEGEHWLRFSGVFGDVTISLPKDVAVSVSINTLFGDVNVFEERKGGFSPDIRYESQGYGTAPKKLRISASQVFGDITVH